MAEEQGQTAPLEPPLGTYPARLDDKGRLKLPAQFQQYLANLKERLFVTSVDGIIAGVYPLSVWRHNKKVFDDADPETSGDVEFLADDLGAEAEMDSQGRVLFPPELRRTLGIENQPVKIRARKGHLEVLSEAVYEARRQQAAQKAAGKIRALEVSGMK